MHREYLRVLPFLAFKLGLAVLALGLTTLLVGIPGNRPKAPAYLTFNTSSLGLHAYHDPSSPLHNNITALVPSDITNPPSITQYLGAHDWYTMHYYSNCSGFYAPSITNPSILTSTKINVTCTRQVSGYTWNLHAVIHSTLHPSVQEIANTVSTSKYQTSTSSSLWYTGLSNAVVTLLELPWNFMGGRPWLHYWEWWNAFISTVMLLSGAAIATNQMITVHHAHGLPGPNPQSSTFLGIMWSTVVLMGLVCVLTWVQWRHESARNGHCYREGCETRVSGDARSVEEWNSDNTAVDDRKL